MSALALWKWLSTNCTPVHLASLGLFPAVRAVTPPGALRFARAVATAMGVVLCSALAGCADLRYYAQAVGGHLQLVQAARPVAAVLADPASSDALRRQLALAQEMRQFAVEQLKLPDNSSYRRYADLGRSHVVWNVVAAPPFSLTPKAWCPPLLGCVTYRGYFAEAPAREWAMNLQAEGFETTVYGVPAYSTLGWTNWMGGDPLLNTFITYPEEDLARLVFHELAHQLVYVAGDTAFNEAFATAVERIGARQWQQARAKGEKPALASRSAAMERAQQRRQAFRALASTTRSELAAVFDGVADPMAGDAGRAEQKAAVMRAFRARYAGMKERLGGDPREWAGYDAWVERANNATLAAQATYEDLTPAFEALYARSVQDSGGIGGAAGWLRFYDAVRALAALPAGQRRAALLADKPQVQAPQPPE